MMRILAWGCTAMVLLSHTLAGQRPSGGAGRVSGSQGQRRAPAAGRPRLAPRTPLDRWLQMSPEQRERALEKLPPERRKLFRERMDRFNRLPKEEQQRLQQRVQRFRELPPEKQEQMRQELRRFYALPAERRDRLQQELELLQGLAEDERRARIASDEFRNKYSAEERELLRDLAENLSIFSEGEP